MAKGRVFKLGARSSVQPVRGRVFKLAARATAVVQPVKGRVFKLAVRSTTVANPPRGRVFKLGVRSTLSTILPSVDATADLTVESMTNLTLAAVYRGAGSVTIWEWQQLSGLTATLTNAGTLCNVLCPAPKGHSNTVVIQVRATTNTGQVTDWKQISITVTKQRFWVGRGGSSRPVLTGPRPVIDPVRPSGWIPTTTPSGLIGDSSTIATWGDSLTAGSGGGNGGYVTILQNRLTGGRVTYNGGVGGHSAQDVAIRQGAIQPTLTAAGNQIPATGSVTMSFAESLTLSTSVAWSCTGTVAGVAGTLSRAIGDTTYTFTRAAAGVATACVAQKFVSTLGAQYRGNVQVLWAGRNDVGQGTDQTVIRNRIVSTNAAMVGYLSDPNKPYVILGVMNRVIESTTATGANLTIYNNIVATNAALAAAHGQHFIDVRSYLIANGLRDAGLTATATDTTNMNADTLPTQLTTDGQHLTTAGYTVVANLVEAKLKELNYLPGGTVTPPTGAVTSGLGWLLPADITNQTRKVFAHYFGPYPDRFSNVVATSDSYLATYTNPDKVITYSEGPGVSFGGYFRGMPMAIPPAPAGTDWLLEDTKRAIRQAKASGIDGFCFDLLGVSGANYDRYQKLCDANALLYPNGGFWMMPMLDANGTTPPGPTTQGQHLGVSSAVCAASLNTFLSKSGAFKTPTGEYVIGTFYHDVQTAAKWKEISDALLANHGKKMVWAAVYRSVANAPNYTQWATGIWGSGSTPLVAKNQSSAWLTAARLRGEKTIPPAWVTDVRAKSQRADESVGFQTQIEYWNFNIANNADLVQITTWSDYSEGAQINPSAHAGWCNLDIGSFLIHKWKYGVEPVIKKDVVYLAHRNQFWDAPLSGPQTLRMQQWVSQAGGRGANAGPKQNIVQTLTFLTDPAQVTVTINGVATTYTAPKGMFLNNLPLVAGSPPSVVVKRNGVTTCSVTSVVPVNATPYNDDLEYHKFSSERGTDGQFQPNHQTFSYGNIEVLP